MVLKNMLWLLLGITLTVLGSYLMTKVNRRDGKNVIRRRDSVFLSFLDLFFSILGGIIFGDASSIGLGGLSVLTFIVGIIMTLANVVLLMQRALPS